MGPRARGPRELAAHPASGNYSLFYSLSLISDIYCQMHHYLRMGVYNIYSPLGVDSTSNRHMGARMHSLGSILFLLIRISCLDSVRPIGKVYSITLNTSLLPLQYRAPLHSRLIDRSFWCRISLDNLPIFDRGVFTTPGFTVPPILYRPGGAFSQGLRSPDLRTSSILDSDFSVVSWAHSLPFRY